MTALFVILLAVAAVFLTVVLMKMSSDKESKKSREKPTRKQPKEIS